MHTVKSQFIPTIAGSWACASKEQRIWTQCFKFEAIQRQELTSKIDEFSTFLGKLAYQLIFNDLIEEGQNLESEMEVQMCLLPKYLR